MSVNDSAHQGFTPRGEARRQRLLAAAREVFLDKGYAGASVNDIVARAGGSLSTLYKLFGNKEGLFVASMEAQASSVWSRLGQAGERPPEEVLTELARDLMDLALPAANIRLIRGIAAEAERTPDLGALFLDHGPDRTRRELADYLKAQHQRGRLTVKDPRAAAGIFTGMVLGEWMLDSLVGRPPQLDAQARDERARLCTQLFLGGLGGQ
ncbi:TetR/AcrR family transcriptional regulator [Halomonas denitrificans]|uniref:TetR/AcrR family transcriptional regulator n=1 Tax=Halomonas denitrificans TaxID=370769 RepID=UPI001CD573B4|nr:TetR/AcrR family transcriptional regulator [Halomonas denitrificans]MCA0976727.1 TetR/AcrR family transcriptional regulator [Halomonas denitrificans]